MRLKRVQTGLTRIHSSLIKVKRQSIISLKNRIWEVLKSLTASKNFSVPGPQ
jgi:hypothetical protein